MMGVLACFAFAVTLILALGPAFDARERRNRRARDRADGLRARVKERGRAVSSPKPGVLVAAQCVDVRPHRRVALARRAPVPHA